MSSPVLLCEDRGSVRFLTLNRPEKLNALNGALTAALTEALKDATRETPVRAIVIAGAGRAFCAGADVNELAGATDEQAIRAHAARTASLHLQLSNLAKPVIAAVHGLALGGGCGLAIACDMVVAAEGAQFGYPEITRGVVPALVAPALVRQVGWKVAFELLATGARIDSKRALAIGMINRVVRDDAVLPAAESLGIELADRDPTAMRWLKRAFHEAREGTLENALHAAREINAASRIDRLARAKMNNAAPEPFP